MDWYDRNENKKLFGMEVGTSRVSVEAACQACRALEAAGLMVQQSSFLQKWWQHHKEQDAKRIAREEQEERERVQRENLRK